MPTKEELEKDKLAAEIAELEQKVQFAAKKEKWSGFKTFTTLTLTFLSIGAGLITLIINSTQFIEQRQKIQRVELSKNMIELVNQLNEDDVYKQENAAILLSYYYLDAVPILLKNLERVEDPTATIYSLQLIEENKGIRPQQIIKPMLQSARKIFANNVIEDEKTIRAIRNYIRALADLGKARANEVIKLIEQLRDRITTATSDRTFEISDPAKHIIMNELNVAIKKLQN